MDEKGRFAKARISRVRVFEWRQAERRNASRIARGFCQSREVLQTPRANVCPNLLHNRMQPAIVREVAVNLTIPGGVIALPDKGGKLRYFVGGESVYGNLYFGETHR
jgi:hypothetical protein